MSARQPGDGCHELSARAAPAARRALRLRVSAEPLLLRRPCLAHLCVVRPGDPEAELAEQPLVPQHLFPSVELLSAHVDLRSLKHAGRTERPPWSSVTIVCLSYLDSFTKQALEAQVRTQPCHEFHLQGARHAWRRRTLESPDDEACDLCWRCSRRRLPWRSRAHASGSGPAGTHPVSPDVVRCTV